MIYPAPGVRVGAPPPSFEEVILSLDDGVQVVAWHRPLPAPSARLTMIFFHGNGENLETLKYSGLYERLVDLDLPVLVVDYPGYGRSTGQPSERSLKDASEKAQVWIRQEYPEAQVVPCGWSLGAALAVHLAAAEPGQVAGLVALSPWVSLGEVAQVHFPNWLVSMGLRESYDSLAVAAAISSPALVLHGTADRIIPSSQGHRLSQGLRAARWAPVEGAGHNDLLAFPRVWQEIGTFLTGLRALPGL